MRRIQHPRATAAFDRDPPSKAAVEIGNGSYRTANVDEDGHVVVPDKYADAVMDGLADQYDVEYDRDAGAVITDDVDAAGGDEPPDDGSDEPTGADTSPAATAASEDDDDTDGDDDLDAWADWNEDDWLSLGYQDRKADVEAGLVDDHLEAIIDVESNQSKTVREAAEQRLAELEDDE